MEGKRTWIEKSDLREPVAESPVPTRKARGSRHRHPDQAVEVDLDVPDVMSSYHLQILLDFAEEPILSFCRLEFASRPP